LGSELESPTSQLFEVFQIRPTATPLPLLDVIRKQSRDPERLIPEMRSHEKGASRIAIVHVVQQRRKRVIQLVIVVADSLRAPPRAERQQHRGDVVAQRPIPFAGAEQRVPHCYVQEKWK